MQFRPWRLRGFATSSRRSSFRGKLAWVHTLLKGLEKIAASADIPMLVTGDFNSVPGSAAHHLLVQGRIPPSHPELATDPIGILRPASKLCHHLPLVSAYAALATQGPAPGAPDAEQQRQRVDAKTHEPVFTNSTSDFTGTLDYIFYTSNSLITSSCLELPSLLTGSRSPFREQMDSAWDSVGTLW